MKTLNFVGSGGKKACLFFAMIAAALFMFVLAGCSDDDKSGGGGFINTTDTRLVNAADEAWINELGIGYIFKASMTYQAILEYDGAWVESGTGTWSTSDNSLILNGLPGLPYAISADGDTLTFNSLVYTRQHIETIEDGGELDTRLINAADEAWVNNDDGVGYIFKADTTYQAIVEYDDAWLEFGVGTWNTVGNLLILDYLGLPYVISDDGDTLTFNSLVYTRQHIETIEDGGGLDTRLINAADEAWVNSGDGVGYIFKADTTYQAIVEYGDAWIESGSGTWNTIGSFLMLSSMGHSYTMSDDGDTLIFNSVIYIRQYVEVVESDSGLDARLVNVAGEAWVDDWLAGEREGFILQSNGRYMWIVDILIDNSDDVFWVALETGTWHTDNGVLSLIDDNGEVFEDSYTVSANGDILTVFDLTFTKMEVGEVTDPNIEFDSRLVTGLDKAWVLIWDDGDRDGYILLENGIGINIDDYYEGSSGNFAVYSVGTWSVDRGRLVFDYRGDGSWVEDYPYTIQGDVLIWGGVELILTDIDIEIPVAKSRDDVRPLQKKLSKPDTRSSAAFPVRPRRDRGNSWR
ncbi:MAG: hypothetical protein LBU70_08280 [Chitinispirillales bacterium]|jgi:hypothetical protein|nr:hypothetical protein [Chitinispirillales bacterium]